MKRFPPVIQDKDPLEGETVHIPVGGVLLQGSLDIPARATGVVIFAHGSGSSRHSKRNQLVAWRIREKGLGTLLFDLLTAEEEMDDVTRNPRFDIDFLANRLFATARWLLARPTCMKSTEPCLRRPIMRQPGFAITSTPAPFHQETFHELGMFS